MRPKTLAQRRFDELSIRQEAVATPMVIALEESATDEMLQSPERPSTPARWSQPTPRTLIPLEPPMMQRSGSPEAALPDPPTRQAPSTPGDAQMSDQSLSPARLSRSQKFKAKRAAKKRAQDTQEEAGAYSTRTEVTAEAS